MISYRIYLLNLQDRTADQIEASFETDSAALDRAADAMEGLYAAEVWQGDRLVGRLGGQMNLGRT